MSGDQPTLKRKKGGTAGEERGEPSTRRPTRPQRMRREHGGGHTDRRRARSEHEAEGAGPTITKRQRDGTGGRRSRSVGGDAHSARSREKLWGKRNLVSNLLYYSLYTEPRTYYGQKGTGGCAKERPDRNDPYHGPYQGKAKDDEASVEGEGKHNEARTRRGRRTIVRQYTREKRKSDAGGKDTTKLQPTARAPKGGGLKGRTNGTTDERS